MNGGGLAISSASFTGDYRARADVRAVVHDHSPSVIPFGVTGAPLRPLYHMSAFLGGGVPVFDIRQASGAMTDMLVRDAPSVRPWPGPRRRAGRPHARPRRGDRGAESARRRVPERLHRSQRTAPGSGDEPGGSVTYLDAEEARRAEASVAGPSGVPGSFGSGKRRVNR